MKKILFISGVSLVVFWIVGFLLLHVNATIHILLIVACIVLLIRLLYSKSLMQ